MIFITKINMSAPCSMPLCHNIATHSIHDIPGREQTGVIICEECLKGIVDAYAPKKELPSEAIELVDACQESLEAPPEIPELLEVELVGPEPEPEPVKKPVAKKKPTAKKKPVTKK